MTVIVYHPTGPEFVDETYIESSHKHYNNPVEIAKELASREGWNFKNCEWETCADPEPDISDTVEEYQLKSFDIR